VRARNARRFIEEGHKVRLLVRFRGREAAHPEIARAQINRIAGSLRDIAIIEQGRRWKGGRCSPSWRGRAASSSSHRRPAPRRSRASRLRHRADRLRKGAGGPTGGRLRRRNRPRGARLPGPPAHSPAGAAQQAQRPPVNGAPRPGAPAPGAAGAPGRQAVGLRAAGAPWHRDGRATCPPVCVVPLDDRSPRSPR
jgi:hypothetical protein